LCFFEKSRFFLFLSVATIAPQALNTYYPAVD